MALEGAGDLGATTAACCPDAEIGDCVGEEVKFLCGYHGIGGFRQESFKAICGGAVVGGDLEARMAAGLQLAQRV